MNPFITRVVHVAEVLGATFIGAAAGALGGALTIQHPTTLQEWKLAGIAAVGAGIGAVGSRIRGYQFGVPRGVALATDKSEAITPAETPVSKGNVQ